MALYRESYVVRIASDPPALFWTGLGPLSLAADYVIPEDAIAVGAGELISIPEIEELINGTAQRLEFIMSGVSAHTVRLALEDAPSVEGATVDMGRIEFDQDWQQAGPIEWEYRFEARKLTVAREEGRRTISLTIVQGDTKRSRVPMAFFTDADQRRRYPTDAIFSNVASISGGISRRWGPK